MKVKIKILLLNLIVFAIFPTGCTLIPFDPTLTPIINQLSTEIVISTINASDTPSSTFTPIYTLSPISTSTPVPAATPAPLILQPGTPTYIKNFAHPDLGCNWLGVSGQIFDQLDQPAINLVISVKGKLGTVEIDQIAVTGSLEGNVYGPGGYEVKLSDRPVLSSGSVTLQVFDLNAKPLSNEVSIDTFADCEKNLIIINFTTVK